jgi:ABC-2 type transport system ATP-binding protein
MCNEAATALEAHGITKHFGEVRALHDIALTARRGSIHGLLGPNGAGKTTLLRILLGLVGRERGCIRLLDRDLPMRPSRVPDGVAALLDRAGFYPYLSGRRNLALLARMDGNAVAAESLGAALARVGLTADADRRVAGYSAGMRQRLGLAAALLRAPRLLLLDEPTSALDPAGARDVRALARDLARDGAAVVLCSHDLLEVEELCASVTILRHGCIAFAGPVERLRALGAGAAHALHTSDDAAALAIAEGCHGVRVVRHADAAAGLDVTGAREALDAYVVALGRAGVAVRSFQARERSLETVFLHVTAGGGAS